jgi:hypothetical protein
VAEATVVVGGSDAIAAAIEPRDVLAAGSADALRAAGVIGFSGCGR